MTLGPCSFDASCRFRFGRAHRKALQRKRFVNRFTSPPVLHLKASLRGTICGATLELRRLVDSRPPEHRRAARRQREEDRMDPFGTETGRADKR